jgi:F-type H+-transporting ATPase subunit delta
MPGRYATALFELAEADQAFDEVERDLARFGDMMDASEDLVRMVRSPVFSADEQERAVAAVLDKAGIGGLTGNFIKLVARNRRLFAIRDMIRSYRALLAEHRGEVTAEVTSAETLSDAQLGALKDELRISIGRDVQIETRIDASLLGGLVVKVGSRMVDSSLRTKLQSLKIAMKEVG